MSDGPPIESPTPTVEMIPSPPPIKDNLPDYLKKKIFPPNQESPFPLSPQRVEGLTAGQREVATLVFLQTCATEKKLPTDPEGKSQALEFTSNQPEITIDGQEVQIGKIIAIEGDKFVCLTVDEQRIEVPALEILEAQSQIVEQSTETGCIKGSSVTKFLESQKIKPQEGQALTDQQKQFNETLNNFIEQIKGQTIISPDRFADILGTVLTTHPERQQQIDQIQHEIQEIDSQLQNQSLPEEEKTKLMAVKQQLEQIVTLSDEQIKNQVVELAKKINNDSFSPREVDEINKLSETGDIGSLKKILEDKPDDDEETKQKKETARKVKTWLKENGPMIGGMATIILLLMIFQASKSGGGHQGMMG